MQKKTIQYSKTEDIRTKTYLKKKVINSTNIKLVYSELH